MPDTHANEELFKKAFELAKQNLSEINLNNFPKKLSDEENKRLEELNNRIKMLSNKIDSSKSSNLTPDPQWIKEQTEAIREREVISLDHLFNIHADRSAIELFKELETELGKEIVKQISTIDKRCILIIGKDSSLIKGIAGCIYYIHIKNILKNNGAYKSFYYFGCLGLDENKIDDWLEQKTLNKYPCDDDMPYEEYKEMRKTADKPKESAIEKYKSGSTLFMRGLESAKILKRLAGIVQDEKSDGLLIVSALSKENVPDEFLRVCETIYLETPQDQGIPVKKKQINKLCYTYNNRDRIVLYSRNNTEPGNKQAVLTEQETKLFQYLKDDRKTPDEIIGNVWNGYKQKDLRMKRKNVKELRGRLNKKCSKIGVEALISKLTGGYYSLNDIEVVER